MELNREQAIEILDRFDFFQGQRAGRELWNEKPFEVQEQDIYNFARDVSLLKGYIKELTEENERLQKRNAALIEINYIFLKECTPMIKADTVRKMQESIAKHATNGYPRKVRLDVIDQIAKEMLEGSK